MISNPRDNFTGCLMGLAIGDALGTPFEFWRKEKVIEYLENNELELISFQRGDTTYPVGFYTDDTSLTLCLATSLIEKGFDLKDQFAKYRKWLSEGYMTPLGFCYGVGQQTFKALNKELKNSELLDGSEEKSGGNGSLMRCAPIGLYYQGNLNEIKEKSLLSGYITHNSIIAGWSCVILNSIISLIIDNKTKEEIPKLIVNYFSKEMPKEIKDCLLSDYQGIGDDYSFPISGYSLDTLRIAIWSWQISNGFEESIKRVIKLGNDTDTFAAVTGALTGCYYGYSHIPDKWKNKIMKMDYFVKISEDIYNNKSKRGVIFI